MRTFKLFMVWLYARDLLPPDLAIDGKPLTKQTIDGEAVQPLWGDMDLVTLYCFAYTHGIRRLQNEVVSAFIQEHDRTSRFTEINAVESAFAICGPSACLSKFMADEIAFISCTCADPQSLPAHLEERPKAFLAASMRAVATMNAENWAGREVSRPGSEEPCQYHNHVNAKEVEECKQGDAGNWRRT